jgi:Arc/MetJ family transcription regulator
MSRSSIDIDDEACSAVMQRFGFATKSEAVNFALQQLALEPMTLSEAWAMSGTGWHGDLDALRSDRSFG